MGLALALPLALIAACVADTDIPQPGVTLETVTATTTPDTPLVAPTVSTVASANSTSVADASRFPEDPTAPFRALTDDELNRRVQPHLQPGDSIAHAVFEGPFGPADGSLLLIVGRGRGGFAAMVLSGEGQSVERFRVDRLKPSWAESEITAVLFEDVDGDGYVEAVVLARYITGAGSTGAVPFQSNSVLDWNGTALITLPKLEAQIEDLETAADVRAVLGQ
jgi:hypothetical protein